MRRFVEVFCGETLASVTHVLRTVFAGEKINIDTLNTHLSGVFLQKVDSCSSQTNLKSWPDVSTKYISETQLWTSQPAW